MAARPRLPRWEASCSSSRPGNGQHPAWNPLENYRVLIWGYIFVYIYIMHIYIHTHIMPPSMGIFNQEQIHGISFALLAVGP